MITSSMIDLETRNAQGAIRLNKVYVCNAKYDNSDVVLQEINKETDLIFKFKCVFTPCEDYLKVQLGCQINVDGTGKQITIDVCGEFSPDNVSDIDEEVLKKILTKNTMSILFPYLRAYVSNFSSMTDIGTINIPVFNIATVLSNSAG